MREYVSFSLNFSFCSGHNVPDGAGVPPYAFPVDIVQAQDIIDGALKLARERVTGELDAKTARRERLSSLIVRVSSPEARPSAAELTEALGDPDDREVREALREWERHCGGESPSAG